MRKEIAIAIKAGSLLVHSGPAHNTEDYHAALFTERETVRVVGTVGRTAMTYAVARGERLQFNLYRALHHLHHCWQRCMRWSIRYRSYLAFAY